MELAIDNPRDPLDLPVQFRFMCEEDIPDVCRIEQESFQLPWTSGAFLNELANNQFAKYTIMEYNHEVIGYGGMWIIIDEAHVTNIAVKEAFRGKKLGTLLLTEMQRYAAFLGVQKMTLEVRASNVVAQHVYEKLGFRFMGVRRGYYTDNGEDAIIMWVDLDLKDGDSLHDDV